jgi:hypothetical protein
LFSNNYLSRSSPQSDSSRDETKSARDTRKDTDWQPNPPSKKHPSGKQFSDPMTINVIAVMVTKE